MGQRDVAGVAAGSPGDAQAVEMRDPGRGLSEASFYPGWVGGGVGAALGDGLRLGRGGGGGRRRGGASLT